MRTYIPAYIATGLAFLLLDALWLSRMGQIFYRPVMGDIALESFRLAPAVVFYVLYLGGVMVFAITPALGNGRWTTALIYGGLYGFFCYATYDLTNQATLRNWSTMLSVVDISWGTFVTAVSATVGYLVVAAWFR